MIKLKGQTKLVIAITLYLYLVSIPITGALFWSGWKTKNTLKPEKVYDGIVVLTGGVDYNLYINERVNRKSLYDPEQYFRFNRHAERIYAGIEFVISGQAKLFLYGKWVPRILIQDRYESFNTSELVKKFALQNGVPEEKFVIYGQGVNRTLDEAKQLKSFAEENSIHDLLLVTSESHMRRAAALFRNQGLFPDLYSVLRTPSIQATLTKLKNYVPSPKGLKSTMGCLYELVGYLGYFIMGDV
jgi:uncharacterized SAM-binding protein YcdF (DUF218 family)